MRLDGARVLLTGASRGLGAAIARRFADAGASLVLVARDRSRLESLAGEIGGEVFAGDLLDDGFARGLIAAAGPVDVLVNNAGIERTGRVADQGADQVEAVLRLNLTVPARLCADVLPQLLERGHGHLVNMSSLSMAVDTAGWASYSASKAGLSSFSESLRVELVGSGVGLTLVEIGIARTDMVSELRADELAGPVFERALRLRLQRILEPAEVADAVVDAVESGRDHVRLPRRTAVLPALTNVGRRVSRALSPRLPPPT